jgi:3-oxoacyl-[acyl-carrier protein] reductase
MEKKTVLITGASRGLGAALATKYAKNNYNIILNYNNSEEKALKLTQELKKYNIEVLPIKADITQDEEIKKMVDTSIKKFKKIDVLINNAAIAIDTTIEEKTKENFIKTLDTNLIGPFLLSKYVGENMLKEKSGNIINISSTNGIDTYYEYSLDYDASKAALISLTHNLALHYAPYIRVNCVAPGWINTEMNKELDKEYIKEEENKIMLKRFAEPEEIANVVYFLSTEEAKYINNEIIRVDGGTIHA